MKEKITEKGQALLIVLILLLLGSLMIVPALHFASTGLKAGQVYENKASQFYAADSGVEDGLNWLINGKPEWPSWTWYEDSGSGTRAPYTLNKNSVDVTIEMLGEQGSNFYKITSIAQGDTGTTTVNAYVSMGVDFDIDSFPVEGNYTINESENYTGNIHTTGDLEILDNALFIGNIYTEGDLILHDSVRVEGNILSDGIVTLEDGCIVNGIICAPTIGLDDTAIVNSDIFGSVSLQDESQIIGSIYSFDFCPLCNDGRSRILSYIIG